MTANLTIDWEGRMGKYWLALGNGVRSNPMKLLGPCKLA